MYEYRTTPTDNKYLDPMWKDWWFLNCINGDKMIWSKEVKKKRTSKPKEHQKAVTKYFNEHTIKWMCGFYKDLEEQYFDWVKVRAECGKFKEFNEVSEKSAWKKLWENPKPVAEKMLEVAGSQAYWRIYDLSEWDISKIMEPLRQEKQKEEIKREWFKTDEQKKEAQELKNKIEDYIEQHPKIKKEAKEYVMEKWYKLTPEALEKMIHTRCAMIAKKLINI